MASSPEFRIKVSFCSNCGKEVIDSFCENCEELIEEDEEPEEWDVWNEGDEEKE
jgi:hypothetical protein